MLSFISQKLRAAISANLFLKSLVTTRMNEIFSCLTCCGQKFNLMFGNRDKDKHNLSETKRQRWNWNNYLKMCYLRCVLNTSYWWSFKKLILNPSNITQAYFTLKLFTIQLTIFKIWMDNWRMGLANLEEVVRKEKCRVNRMI